jgi:hypothetical protein
MRNKIGPQLCLGVNQAINGNRCDRISTCLDAKLLGEALADPPRGRGRNDCRHTRATHPFRDTQTY